MAQRMRQTAQSSVQPSSLINRGRLWKLTEGLTPVPTGQTLLISSKLWNHQINRWRVAIYQRYRQASRGEFLFCSAHSWYRLRPLPVLSTKHADPQNALRWFAIVVLFVTVLPALSIAVMVRLSKVSDLHLQNREERFLPLCCTLISMIVGTVLLYRLGAAREIVWAGVAYITNSVIFSAITPLWKISFHSSVCHRMRLPSSSCSLTHNLAGYSC